MREVYSRLSFSCRAATETTGFPAFSESGEYGQRRGVFPSSEFKMATTTTEILFKSHETKPQASRRQLEKFDQWFSRCHNTLQYIACLILGDARMADYAVQNCWLKASRNPPSVESEGPFRSWVLRLLISEALSILRQHHTEGFGAKRPHNFAGGKSKPEQANDGDDTYSHSRCVYADLDRRPYTATTEHSRRGDIIIKLAEADTVAIFHQILPPLGGSPLHRHSCEDE